MKHKFIYLLVIFFLSFQLFSQERITTEEYIEIYKDVAIKKMNEFSIPASITLAQGILESGSGNSRLAKQANNHFGIKCHKGWTGKTFTMDDDAKNECFRKYKHASDSYRDHSQFLTQRGRYSFLFDYKISDYKSWAKGLKKAGYATNPKYPELLIRLIEKYDLSQYDTGKKKKRKKKEPKIISEAVVVSALDISNFEPVTTSNEGRNVYENNGVRFIVVKAGDTFYGLAKEFDIYSWQLYKYNDLNKNYLLQIEEWIYLEKKKKKSEKQFKTHTIKEGETLRFISNKYAVKISSLQKRNKLSENREVKAGQKIKLR